MHPTPVFHWQDRDAMLAFVRERAFATLFASSGGRLHVAQAPVIVDSNERCLLHLSRGNPLAAVLPTRVIAVVHGPDAYVSPDWYAEHDQVPTWNYVAVEIEGELTAMDDETQAIVTAQSAAFEARLPNKRPWTPDKMTPGVLAAKLRGIRGAVLTIEALRGTRKLSQNKNAIDRAGVVRELTNSPREADRLVATLIERDGND